MWREKAGERKDDVGGCLTKYHQGHFWMVAFSDFFLLSSYHVCFVSFKKTCICYLKGQQIMFNGRQTLVFINGDHFGRERRIE